MTHADIAKRLLNQQAELQIALGFFRMLMREEATYEDALFIDQFSDDAPYIEQRMQASLAMTHSLMSDLGMPMYNSAQMPDDWTPA